MTVHVNGEPREFPEATTVSGLIAALGLNPKNVVAQRNGDIVERAAFDDVALEEGDSLDLIGFVGGG